MLRAHLRKAAVAAARNEWAPFQVVVNGGERGLSGVNVTASVFRGPGGRIPAPRLYREHYVEVKTPAAIKEGAGWYSDALIPFGEHRAGARFLSTPFELPRGGNQPVWVDLFVPKDAAPASTKGTLTVMAEDERSLAFPWNSRSGTSPCRRCHR